MPLVPAWMQWYKKPSYTDIKEYSATFQNGKWTSADAFKDTPKRLGLDRILQNQTCSPMSLHDFYMYLKFIEYSPENLEFFVWFKHYESTYAKAVAPSVVSSDATCKGDEESQTTSESTSSKIDLDNKQSQKVTVVEVSDQHVDLEQSNEIFKQIVSLITLDSSCACPPLKADKSIGARIKSLANSAGITSTPKTEDVRPVTADVEAARRAEIANVTALFLLPGAEKELNIPPTMRQQVLADIENSSSPHHLKPVADYCYQLLRNCSHRNFIRLGVSNGTFETVCMATSLGIVLTLAGFLLVLLRAFVPAIARHSRWQTFASWPLWWLGMGLILSGLRGSCFFLLLFSRRQPLPWERFEDDASIVSQRSSLRAFASKLMIFDRKVRVKDVNLRELQRKIVLQSLFGGAFFASLMVALFIYLPIWE